MEANNFSQRNFGPEHTAHFVVTGGSVCGTSCEDFVVVVVLMVVVVAFVVVGVVGTGVVDCVVGVAVVEAFVAIGEEPVDKSVELGGPGVNVG